VLWIGCADSRVPESVITKSLPGVIFVQRNIANQLPLDDINALSVLTYAVQHLGTQHVIIAGHSECGGVSASLRAVQSGNSPDRTLPEYPASYPLNRWLAPRTEFIATLGISSLPFEEALPIAVEANVKRQVEHLSKVAVITKAEKEIWVHGWVYDLATGRLRDLEISRTAVTLAAL